MGKRTRLERILLAALVALPAAAAAVPQTKPQQKCVAVMNQHAAALAKEQDRAALRCLQEAARGRTDKLGNPGQTLTAQACLTNDAKGDVAKQTGRLGERDAKYCRTDPAALPGFSYAPAAAAAEAAVAESRAIVAALFGPDLDAALQSRAAAPDAARCQEAVLAEAQKVYAELFKLARTAKAEVLKGTKRILGRDPKAPAQAGPELATELVLRLEADAKGKRAKREANLAKKATQLCTATEVPLATAFPGECAGAADPAALAACAARAATAAFWRAFDAIDALGLPCDLGDDGEIDRSCAEPALLQHVQARLGYGPDAFTRARIEALGVEGYIDEQLAPETIEENPALDPLLAAFPSLTLGFRELRDQYPANPEMGQPGRNDVPVELQRAELLRRIVTHRQLQEVLADLWFNHFNVHGGEGTVRWDATPYLRDAIRPHVLGRFGDLALATARAPAMADYLDNRVNVVGGINENYSRELMELHTLSVAGPYTETDVKEVARILTGWRIDPDAPDGFAFRADLHDFGAKTVLGVAYPAGVGYEEGPALIEQLAAHPSTARFVATKLARRFVTEDPPEALIQKGADAYLASDGEIRATLRALLLSDDFLLYTSNRGTKTKRPSQVWISLARLLDADPAELNTNQIRRAVRDFGEELFQAPPPTGWPDVSGAWSSPGGLVQRLNEVEDVAEGARGFVFELGLDGLAPHAELADAAIAALFPAGVSPETREATIAYLGTLPVFEAPTRVQEVVGFLLASPEFLSH
jgi:hypothetical protein